MHIDVRMWRVDLQRRRAIRKKGIFQRGWNLPIRAKGNNARCWMRTQSTNKQTLLRVGNCEWLSHGWYINFCPDCGSSNQSYSKIKAKSMQLQNTFNWHLLTLLLASCDHLWVISNIFWDANLIFCLTREMQLQREIVWGRRVITPKQRLQRVVSYTAVK